MLEAIAILKDRGIAIEAMFAGGQFQEDYLDSMEKFIKAKSLNEIVRFVGSLTRPQLARFFMLNHVCVCPSIYPEAFGIVAAEGMGSGLALVSSGVGGAAELFEPGVSGLKFEAGDAEDLAWQLQTLAKQPSMLKVIQSNGQARVNAKFCVEHSVAQLEKLWMTYR